MKKMMTAALWAGMMAQVAAQILLWNRVKILEREPKEEKPAESPAFLEPGEGPQRGHVRAIAGDGHEALGKGP